MGVIFAGAAVDDVEGRKDRLYSKVGGWAHSGWMDAPAFTFLQRLNFPPLCTPWCLENWSEIEEIYT